jgi:FkbM family methyltransferase
MLIRLERKLAEIQRWVDSVGTIADWPAAFVLALFRTRQASGDGVVARACRRLFPHISVRPARLPGLWVRINPDEISPFVVYEEVFVEGGYDLSLCPFTPDLVIDCGAFEGYFSMLAAVRFPEARILAFEPGERNRETLRANVERNRLAIDVRAEAVSNRDGSAVFSGIGCCGRLGDSAGDGVIVPVVDLGRLIRDANPQRLLLKLDIEGEEATLLPALLPVLPPQSTVFFEWHQGREEYRRAVELLAAAGFTTTMTRENVASDVTVYIDAVATRG